MTNTEIEKFTQRLLKDYPKFIAKMKPDDLQPYMLFGDLGIYVRDLINRGNYNVSELEEIFEFLNEMGCSTDEEVHNLLTVGVLEILTDSREATLFAEKKLNGAALKDLELIHKFWSD